MQIYLKKEEEDEEREEEEEERLILLQAKYVAKEPFKVLLLHLLLLLSCSSFHKNFNLPFVERIPEAGASIQ